MPNDIAGCWIVFVYGAIIIHNLNQEKNTSRYVSDGRDGASYAPIRLILVRESTTTKEAKIMTRRSIIITNYYEKTLAPKGDIVLIPL